MKRQGWKSPLADRCLFILYDDDTGEVIGACGLHVDDLLICGDESHPKFQKAEADCRRRTNVENGRLVSWTLQDAAFPSLQMEACELTSRTMWKSG